MNVILQLLLATILLAGMIFLRLDVDRRARRTKICDAGGECRPAGCFNGCGKGDENAPGDDLAAGPDTLMPKGG